MSDILWWVENAPLHFTLIDPDKQPAQTAADLAALSQQAGSDAIMIGGSTAGHEVTDEITKAIKGACTLPTILFPSTAAGLSQHADYIFWMMLMNSQDRRFLVGEQMKAAPYLKKLKVKPIPMGYIVISTSKEPTTVEKVGKVDKILPQDVDKAVSYALTSQYYGMDCVYLEAGSGADEHVPSEMIKAVRAAIDIPLIVGGGVRTMEAASKVIASGADILVTGTIAERDPEIHRGIISSVKK